MKRAPIAVASSLLLWLLLGLTPVGCSSEEPSATSGSGGFSGSLGGSGGSNAGRSGAAANPSGAPGASSGAAGNASGGMAGPASGGAAGASAGGAVGQPAAGAGGSIAGGGAGSGGNAVAGGGSSGSAGEEPYPPPPAVLPNETGANLWLRYPEVNLPSRLAEYRAGITGIVKAGTSATLQAAQAELMKGLRGLLSAEVPVVDAPAGAGAVVLGTPASSTIVSALPLMGRLPAVGAEGYLIEAAEVGGNGVLVVAANSDVGVLRGAFALLRHLQRHRPLQGLMLSEAPKIKRRLLNHWDNLDGSVERGYAGRSLWNWGSLPATISQRYTDYARANASLGINGTVLNNVNSNAQILSAQNLDKVAALAAAFRPYGISVYLSARFSAPIELGGLTTADPLASTVAAWWASKVDEIYTKIPDFGGFLVKANSEGQPGPQDYNRSHADGSKMLAAALAPHGGVVLWRAFVYATSGADRIRQAHDEFEPLDGNFGSNAFVQVKNGPLDFQPREPHSPLIGAMPNTPLSLELQITKEYLGQDTHLAYLGTLFEEVLKTDTQVGGPGKTVARIIDGTVDGHADSAIAGVANIGSDTNWTGSHFNQANWYAFGRMAWDPDLSALDVADEWVRQTFSNDPRVVTPTTSMMMESREALVNYMTPLGLAHIMGTDHHYGPAPWVNNLSQANWNPFYYHEADAMEIGFDRTASGSDAVSQYAAPVRDMLASRATVPDSLLLFFHRVGWNETLSSSGRSLWDELVHRYSTGVDAVGTWTQAWAEVEGLVDGQRFSEVGEFLKIQHYEARWWRDACLTYFASVSGRSIPSGYAAPAHDLAYYRNLAGSCPANVTKPRCDDIYSGEPSPAVLP